MTPSFPDLSYSADITTACSDCLRISYDQAIEDLREAEDHFALYRWYEQKLRRLYYGPIWEARQSAENPFDAQIRSEGRDAESALKDLAAACESQITEHANGVIKLIKDIQDIPTQISRCHGDSRVKLCINKSLAALFDDTEATLKTFDRIFENERLYRESVLRTAAGKKGLYAEDALESLEDHEEAYLRYETEHAPFRFKEDQEMASLFLKISLNLKDRITHNECCYAHN